MPNSTARRRALLAVAATLITLGLVLVLALAVGGRSRTARSTPATPIPLATYTERAPHVLSALVVNAEQGEVSGASVTPPSELSPLPASAFSKPVAQYRAYAVHQLGLMEGQITRLQRSLAANDRAAAQTAWHAAYANYLRLGAVYLDGQVATLNREIDGTPGGLPGGTASPQFTGLHRIEDGLWGASAPRTLFGLARRLDVDVHTLRGLLPRVSITPREYATRVHEILEDAVRDLISGIDVPWSGAGVLGTDAGLEATEEVIATLRPLLKGRENVTLIVDAQLASLRATMASLDGAHGGQLPSNGALTQQQAELLDSSLGGALEALAQVPGALEAESPPRIPSIPARDVRIDP